VDDFKLPGHHGHAIAKAVHEQLTEHEGAEEGEVGERQSTAGRGVVNKNKEDAGDEERERGALDRDGEEWWRCWRKRIRTEDRYVKLGGEESEGDAETEADIDMEIGDDGEADAEADDVVL